MKDDVDLLLEDDDFYYPYVTPLKPLSAVKQQHRNQINEFLNMEQFREILSNAEKMIRSEAPRRFSLEESDKIIKELDESSDHYINFAKMPGEDNNEKPALFQEMLGISDESLVLSYKLAQFLIEEKQYSEAEKILIYLTTLAPDVVSFWISIGICMQALNEHSDAIYVFNIAKTIDSQNPASFIYSAESYLALNDVENAKQEIQSIKDFDMEGESDSLINVLNSVKNNL